MLGIIGAMDIEINAIKSKIEAPAKSTLAGAEFKIGRAHV